MKKKLVIMISGVIISIAIVTLIILYFCTDTFKSPEELFWTFAKQNSKLLSVICNENAKVQKEIKEKNNYVSDGNINITVEKNEEIKNIDIATNTVHDVETERTYSKITLKEQENDLLKLFCIKDYNTYGIKCEDLLKHYIGVRNANLKNFAQKLNVNKEIIQYIPDSIDINDIEKEHLISTYSNIFIQNIPKTSYIKLGKKDIQIEEKSYEAKVYLLKLSGDEICNIIIKCLENSMKDEVLLQMLERNKIDNYKEIASNLIVKINEQRIEEEVKIEIYVNKKEVVRTSINIGSKYKLTIDYAYENNSLKLLIFLEISTENISYNSKIIVDKNEEDNFVTNNIIITPNINKPMYNYKIVNKIGKMENNYINNSIITTIMNENGIKVSSIYNQNIQVGANGEKIAELKDSSAVILNNYTLKQLQPFIEKYIINKFQNLTQKFEKIGFDELAPKIKLEVISTIGSSFISTNGDGITEKIINGIWIFATDYAQKNSIINDKLNNNEAEAQKILKTYISADGSRNISATNLNKIYEVLIEHNSIMSKEDLIMVNGETSIKKIEEYKKNIDIGKTYKIQIKAYKTNGAISEIEVKENEMKTNLIEENAQE